MWKNYVNFGGRASVRDYWMAYLFNFIISFAIGLVVGFVKELNFLSSIYSLAILIPSLAISVRRLNDAGYSWKSLLWFLCPLVGWIIVLIRLCKKSV